MSLPNQKLPPLEQETLGRILRGEDPWNGWSGAAGMTGRYSRAVNSLINKGYAQRIWNESDKSNDYVGTDLGRQVFREEP